VFLDHVVDINAVPSDLHDHIRLPNLNDSEGVSDDLLEPEAAHTIVDYLHW